jgi:hypothetical protein
MDTLRTIAAIIILTIGRMSDLSLHQAVEHQTLFTDLSNKARWVYGAKLFDKVVSPDQQLRYEKVRQQPSRFLDWGLWN